MTPKQIARTLDVLALACAVPGLFLHGRFSAAFFFLSALLAFGSSVWPNPLTDAVARGWMALSRVLGRGSSAVALFLVFYCVLTPVAFLSRLFNRDAAVRFFSKEPVSMLHAAEPGEWDSESFRRTW